MPNMNVVYQRADFALQTLVAEVYKRYNYKPTRPSEYLTGYPSPGNFTGHNPDSNGIAHAVDIFTDDNGNLPEAQGRELAERLRQIGAATNRFAYLIHDMSPGAPAPKIAGQFNGWRWEDYTGDNHSDHIHVSMCDLYYGDPAPLPASVYDSKASWGIAGINPSGGGSRPIETKDWFDMATEAQLDALLEKKFKNYLGPINTAQGPISVREFLALGTRAAQAARDAVRPVKRGGKEIPVNQELADTKTLAQELKAQVALLTTAVKALADSKGLDATALGNVLDAKLKEIPALVQEGIADGTVDVTVTVNGPGDPTV